MPDLGKADTGHRKFATDQGASKEVVASAAVGELVQLHIATRVARKGQRSALAEQGREPDLELDAAGGRNQVGHAVAP
jgi:hypothetical protein